MAKPPLYPLLRLDPPQLGDREKRKGFPQTRKFSVQEQINRPPGQRLSQLSNALAAGRDPLELRLDPEGIAPERLLVFELTGDVSNFARAARRIDGLEFLGAEDFEPDEFDASPTIYLMIPNTAALRQLVRLWNLYARGQALPEGYAPWRDLFAQLRDLRPWGPVDRVSAQDLEILQSEQPGINGRVRLEIELVFRPLAAGMEPAAVHAVEASGGQMISRARIDGAMYHAMLVDVPTAELGRVIARGREGIIAQESIMQIRPQSMLELGVLNPPATEMMDAGTPPGDAVPIAAVFDAVPLAGHPLLVGRLSVDDPFSLEPLAVGARLHGTAMASAVIHGDLAVQTEPLSRQIFFLNVMYAPGTPGAEETFPDRLPADLFHEAVARMKGGNDPTAPTVVLINASLGDRNKPFSGRMSGWAKVVDYLSHRYEVLFVISAGNHLSDLTNDQITSIAFEALDPGAKARSALRASAAGMRHRRLLAPSEAMNALTVGALNNDGVVNAVVPAGIFDVWRDTGMCSVSSALGPGFGNSVKPDVLASGGRHHVRVLPQGNGHLLRPLGKVAQSLGGIVVAAPSVPTGPQTLATSRTIGTSVAAALMTGIAARAHEALEMAYEDFLTIPGGQRAVLLKAMIVHCAEWTNARDLIVEILGPNDNRRHVQQKDNVRRYLGFGAVDPNVVLDCTVDRATMWAVGRLSREQSQTFRIPLPQVMSGRAQSHEISVTVAWFAPPRVGTANYRGVRLKIIEPSAGITAFGVKAVGEQPDTNQSHRGTVIHRRWSGAKAAVLGAAAVLEMMVQRQPDEIDEPTPFAVITTVKMPAVNGVYTQVRDRLAIKPRIPVAV